MALRTTFSMARRSTSRSAVHGELAAAGEGDPATARVGFDLAILNHFAEELIEAEAFAGVGGGVAFGAGDLYEAADQVGEARDFFVHARDGGVAVVGSAGEFGGEAEAGQRRAKFVGDVLQQAALGGKQGADALRHAVEGAADFADFILARELTRTGDRRRRSGPPRGRGRAGASARLVGEDPAEQCDGGEDQKVVGQILAEIEEVFVDDKETVLAVGRRVRDHLAVRQIVSVDRCPDAPWLAIWSDPLLLPRSLPAGSVR